MFFCPQMLIFARFRAKELEPLRCAGQATSFVWATVVMW